MLGLTRAKLAQLGLLPLERLYGYGPTLNGGLVALNLRRWRESNLTERIQELIPRLRQAQLKGFSGMSTASDAQTPMWLLSLNSTPMDVQPLPPSWNVDGLGWKRIPEKQLCNGDFLHWSGIHKPWNSGKDPYVRYSDLWKPYASRVAAAQARYGAFSQRGAQRACSNLEVVQQASRCTEQRIAAIDALADEVSQLQDHARWSDNRRMRNHKHIDTAYRALDLKLVNHMRETVASLRSFHRKAQRLVDEDRLTRESVQRVHQSLETLEKAFEKALKSIGVGVGILLFLTICCSISACCIWGDQTGRSGR